MNRPRVLLADDYIPLLERVAKLLTPSFDVVGAAGDGQELVSLALRLTPDVIVVDIVMPILDGIEAVHQLRNAGLKAKFVFLTVHSESEFVAACLERGAMGYVLKSRIGHDLVAAITAAIAGKRFVSSALSLAPHHSED